MRAGIQAGGWINVFIHNSSFEPHWHLYFSELEAMCPGVTRRTLQRDLNNLRQD
jgi:DNA-binding HxlR family transcriptional regulator